MWWEFHRLMDLSPEQLVDEDDPIGLLEPIGPIDAERRGQADLAIQRSRPRNTTSARHRLFDPAQEAARPGRNSRSTGRSVTSSTSIRRPSRSTSGGRCARPIRGPSCRSRGSRPRNTRRACSSSANGRRHARIDGRGRVIGQPRDLLLRLPPRCGQARGRGACSQRRDGPCRCAPARPRTRSDDPRHPGSAGFGQDIQRRPNDLLAACRGRARRDHRDEPQGHRQPPQGGADRRRGRGRGGPTPSSAAMRTRSSTTSR